MERTPEIRDAYAAFKKESENFAYVTNQVTAGNMDEINHQKAKAELRKAQERYEEVAKGTIFSLP